MAAGDEDLVLLAEQRSRRTSGKSLKRKRLAPKVAGLPAERGVRAGPRSETAHAIVDFLRGAIPVDAAVFFFQKRSIGGVGVILRARGKFSAGDAPQCFGHERRAGFRHALGQLRGSFLRRNLDFFLQEHVAGVHASIDAHGGEAGGGFAVGDGPVDGRSAAIFGEQGSMKVNPAELRNG